jgi:3-keto-disaccharide hydrolase
MKAIVNRNLRTSVTCLALLLPCLLAPAATDDGWIELIGKEGFDHWRSPGGDWIHAGDAEPDPKNPSRLIAKDGNDVIVNGASGKTRNLLSKQDFGDLEAHFEFKIPKGSNSGIKLEGLYEIQIHDSFGVATPKASHSGGIYPRAEMLPRYHHIDEGTPPRTNAAKKAGEWQTLDVVFRAPRFDADGKKIKNARFDKVVLNGQVIHEGVDVKTPTGHAWHLKEIPRGPILLQGDHGPVAFRKIRVKQLD